MDCKEVLNLNRIFDGTHILNSKANRTCHIVFRIERQLIIITVINIIITIVSTAGFILMKYVAVKD